MNKELADEVAHLHVLNRPVAHTCPFLNKKYTITHIVTFDAQYNLDRSHASLAPGSKGRMFVICTRTELAFDFKEAPVLATHGKVGISSAVSFYQGGAIHEDPISQYFTL